MRFVSRGSDPPPAALMALDKQDKSELERARVHAGNPDPQKGAFSFAKYKDDGVKQHLDRLFHGKCAYCETFYSASAPVDVEHYRPKGSVSEDKNHPGYWWLAMSWDNLLPSCIDCNRRRHQITLTAPTSLAALHNAARILTGKQDSFPVAGVHAGPEDSIFDSEQALLLNPCVDDPSAHLIFHIDRALPCGLILPTGGSTPSPRGLTSIQVYGLNRLGLVQDRTRILRRLEFLAMMSVELAGLSDEIESVKIVGTLPVDIASKMAAHLGYLQDRILGEMRDMANPAEPYSTMVVEWLRQFRDSL